MSVYQRQESPYWYYQFKIRKQRYRGPTKEPERELAEADERAMRQNINDESGLTTPPMNEVLKRYLIAIGERIMQGQEALLNRVAALEHDVKALRCDFDALKDELRKEDGDQVDRIAGGTLTVKCWRTTNYRANVSPSARISPLCIGTTIGTAAFSTLRRRPMPHQGVCSSLVDPITRRGKPRSTRRGPSLPDTRGH